MRSTLAAFGLAIALLATGPAFAHGDVELIGKVTAVTATAMKVQTVTGEVVEITIDKETRYFASGKLVAVKDLKVGQTVKVAGYGDSAYDMVALEVTVQPAARAG